MYYLTGQTTNELRAPYLVPDVTSERAKALCQYQPLGELINPATQPVWFRTDKELYIPYWQHPHYQERLGKNGTENWQHPKLIYQPYWMKNRRRLIQTRTAIRPKSNVLYHLGTDDEDGLGKGFNPFKAVKRAVTFTKTSFQPKKLFGAVGSVASAAAGFAVAGPVGAILPSALAPKVFSANSKLMKQVGMGVTAAAAVAGAIYFGPAVAAVIGPKLAAAGAMLGKAAGSLTKFLPFFQSLSPQGQKYVSDTITPEQIAAIERGMLDPNYVASQVPVDPSYGFGREAMGFGPSLGIEGQAAQTDWTMLALVGGAALLGGVVLLRR